MNKRKDINYWEKENYLSVAAIFFYKLPADLNNNDVELNLPDFNKSNVGFQQVGCRIFTSRMSDLGFLKSDVGWHLEASVPR